MPRGRGEEEEEEKCNLYSVSDCDVRNDTLDKKTLLKEKLNLLVAESSKLDNVFIGSLN